jgi:hypothetical protein
MNIIMDTLGSRTPRAAGVCCAAFVKRLRMHGWSREAVDGVKVQAIDEMREAFDDCSSHLASNCVRLLESGEDFTEERLRDLVEAEVFAEFALLGIRVADSFDL